MLLNGDGLEILKRRIIHMKLTWFKKPARIDEILSGICTSDNDTSNMNDSQTRNIVEIRCILKEARKTIPYKGMLSSRSNWAWINSCA